MRWVVLGLAMILIAAGYVRLAPVNPAAWSHLPDVDGPGDTQGANSYTIVRQIQTAPEGLMRALETAAIATPRTKIIARSAETSQLLIETRSALWGFPDYTTAAVQDGLLVIQGRARFGFSDLGQNKARITGWLAQLGPLIAPL